MFCRYLKTLSMVALILVVAAVVMFLCCRSGWAGRGLDPLAFGLPNTARELISQRTENVAVFQLSSGKFAAVSSPGGVFTRNKNGLMVPVEEKGRVEGDKFVFDRLSRGVEIRFDLFHPRYTLVQGEYSYTVEFSSPASAVIENDRTVAYKFNHNITLRWSVAGGRVKKEIYVAGPGPLSDLSFSVRTSSNLTMFVERDSIVMKNSQGQIIFRTDPPFLLDKNHQRLVRAVHLDQKNNHQFQFRFVSQGLEYPYIIDPSSGPNSPGSVAQDSVIGNLGWDMLSEAFVSDGTHAFVTLTNSSMSYYLVLTNFGFSIPASTIDNITVDIQRYCVDGYIQDNSIRLIKGGGISGSDNSASSFLPQALQYDSFGGDLWGLAWSSYDINASNFGVAISAINNNGFLSDTVHIDHVRITVTYTPIDRLKGSFLDFFF